MAFRFRKSIKIIPGVRLNVSKSGFGLSAGARGASVSMGARGVYSNVGLPGTGMSFRSRLDGKGASTNNRRAALEQGRQAKVQAKIDAERHRNEALAKVSLNIKENGAVEITDAFGEQVRGKNLGLLWEQHTETIRTWLEEQADKINGDVSLLEKIHEDSPFPDSLPIYDISQFDTAPPEIPKKPETPAQPERQELPKLNAFLRMFKSKRQTHIDAQQELDNRHNSAMKDWEDRVLKINKKYEAEFRCYLGERSSWEQRKREHDIEEERIASNLNELLMHDVQVMESVLDRAISQMDWPRETLVSYEVKNNGSS